MNVKSEECLRRRVKFEENFTLTFCNGNDRFQFLWSEEKYAARVNVVVIGSKSSGLVYSVLFDYIFIEKYGGSIIKVTLWGWRNGEPNEISWHFQEQILYDIRALFFAFSSVKTSMPY